MLSRILSLRTQRFAGATVIRFFLLTLLGCSGHGFLPAEAQHLITINDLLPVGAYGQRIKSVSIPDGERTHCGYLETLEIARKRARKQGANVLVIFKVEWPDAQSRCFRLRGTSFRSADTAVLLSRYEARRDSIIRLFKPKDSTKAVVCIYRPFSYFNVDRVIDVRINEVPAGALRNEDILMIERPAGHISIASNILNKPLLELDADPGKTYFVRGFVFSETGVPVGVVHQIQMALAGARADLFPMTADRAAFDLLRSCKFP